MNIRQKKTRALTLSAILSALGVVIMYLGSIITVLDLTMMAIASMVVTFAVLYLDRGWATLIYAVTSVLSLLILPDKFIAVLYLVFGGVYPMLKALFERTGRLLGWVLKLAYFNIVLLALIFSARYLLFMADAGISLSAFVILGGNAVFIVYDIALSRLITLYLLRARGGRHGNFRK